MPMMIPPIPYRGLLDMTPQQAAPTGVFGLWGQNIADIIPLFKRGLLNMGTEGARGRMGGGGPRIGSPEWTRAYEAQHGLQPGTMRPIEPPAPTPMQHTGPLRDFGPAGNSKVSDPRMLTPKARAERRTMSPPSNKQMEQLQRNKEAAFQRQPAVILANDVKAWQAGPGKGKLPFDSKVLSDRYDKLTADQQQIFRMIFGWE